MSDRNPVDLVGTEWLAEHLDDDGVRVVDATWTPPGDARSGRDIYNTDHIVGTVFWDINFIADAANPLPHMLPDEATFTRRMEELGIGNDTFVIAYDAFGIWGSGFLDQGQKFSFTFKEPGTFAYFCALHNGMQGTITVTEP